MTKVGGPELIVGEIKAQPALSNQLVTTKLILEEKLAIVYIHRAPANAFSYELIKTMTETFRKIEEIKSIRTVIFTSSVDRFFSAGVDLEEFGRGKEEWLDYWRTLRSMFITIYESRLNIISAINGFAIGLGCALALASQDRYMLNGPGTIGINPVNIGIPVPIWLMQRYVELVGQRLSEKLLIMGVSLKAPEAKEIGLVDEVFENEEEMLAACIELARAKHKINELAQVETNRLLRHSFVKTFYAEEEEDVERMAYFVQLPEIKQIIQDKLEEMRSRRASRQAEHK
ncbi:ClpP/crotonase [Basidiobolus meristosporus CBS 931.73]|uniref:ClpP/crotonase n=1 Tax=Basidiobolus meristosporus CBS 931.73 TaxID=1314790 RepID=A0A1Y1Y7F0_9FUNG|nr:ClpP/crotonase [Basidiobolus meristosporus CBS 931.73]|eukprot:ORX93889.1 ClpP/crotonase [Basidiobolus meristosporus CBS 931.73]